MHGWTKLSHKHDGVLRGVVHEDGNGVMSMKEVPLSLTIIVRKSHTHWSDVG